MAEGIKFVDVPVADMINMKTGKVAALLDGTINRMQSIAVNRAVAFMDGTAANMPDQKFYTDLRTAVMALTSLRKHF
jgi:hypothetical protein